MHEIMSYLSIPYTEVMRVQSFIGKVDVPNFGYLSRLDTYV